MIYHDTALTLRDVTFVVRTAGWRKCLREGRKNVHAFAVGAVQPARKSFPAGAVRLSYNPRTGPYFRRVDTSAPVARVRRLFLLSDGRIYAYAKDILDDSSALVAPNVTLTGPAHGL